MEKLDIFRLEKSRSGTFGVLRVDGEVFCVTLEPPDLGNLPEVSCIPAGEYVCRRVESPSFGTTFEIGGVPGRDHILFHQGNVVSDTRGCVLLGRSFGMLGAERAVVQSRPTFREFLDRCGDARRFTVSIQDQS
jgi:hypothetical protein